MPRLNLGKNTVLALGDHGGGCRLYFFRTSTAHNEVLSRFANENDIGQDAEVIVVVGETTKPHQQKLLDSLRYM